MTAHLKATYEQGVLRLSSPIALEDGALVDVIVMTAEGVPTGQRSPAEILAAIAALPLEPGSGGFSGANHEQMHAGRQRRSR